ncbi:MAG: acyltransferase [Bacteroidota bacterium]
MIYSPAVSKANYTIAASTTTRKVQWFEGINSIRFVLALIVLLGHAKNPIGIALRQSDIPILHYIGGFLGVSFVGICAVVAFFIISGFVIHYPNKNGIADLKKFYIRRFLRVLIPLIIIELLGIPLDHPEKSVVWSLYCELIYYAIYPLLAYAKKISWTNKVIIAYIITFLLIVVGAKHDILSMMQQHDANYVGEYWQLGVPYTWLIGLPCWLLGVRLADKIDDINSDISFRTLMVARVLVFAFSVIACTLRFHFFVSYIISLTLFAFPILKWIEMEICYYKYRKANTTLENWGKFSYSLYLCHPLILHFLYDRVEMNSYTYPVYIAVVLAASYGFYLILEKPSHLLAQKLTSQKPVMSLQK